MVPFNFPFGPKDVVALFRKYFGPTQRTFARLDAAAQDKLAIELEKQWAEHNQSTDGSTCVDAEYLDVRAVRA